MQTQDGACGPKQELHLQPRWVITGDDMGTLGESAIGGLSLGVSLGVSLFSMLLVLVTKNSVLHAFGHDLLVRFRRVKSETIF